MEKKSKKKGVKQWRVGEYLRLSNEDETSGTGLSIENQKAVIQDFLFEDPESVEGMQLHFENYFNEYFVKMTSKKFIRFLK